MLDFDIQREADSMKMAPLLYGGAAYRRQMQYETALENEMMQDLKVQQQIIQTQSAQVGLDTANFRLKELKDKAAREAEMHQMLPQVVDRQLDVINNPSLTPYEKDQELNKIKMQLGPLAIVNPSISATFDSSRNITTSQINKDTRDAIEQDKKDRLEREEQDRNERRMITIMESYAKTGNVKELEEYTQNLPSSLAGVGQAFISSAKSNQVSAQRGVTEKIEKDAEARRKQFFDFNKGIWDDLKKFETSFGEEDLEKRILPPEDIQEIATTITTFYNPDVSYEELVKLGNEDPNKLIRLGLNYAGKALGGTSASMPSAQSKISGSMGR